MHSSFGMQSQGTLQGSGSQRQEIENMLTTSLPLWATEAQSPRGPLRDCVRHILELFHWGIRMLGYLSTKFCPMLVGVRALNPWHSQPCYHIWTEHPSKTRDHLQEKIQKYLSGCRQVQVKGERWMGSPQDLLHCEKNSLSLISIHLHRNFVVVYTETIWVLQKRELRLREVK